MLYAVHCNYICILVTNIALCMLLHSAFADYFDCSVTRHVFTWPLYVYLTGPSTVITRGTNIFGWCPGSTMGVHPEAGGVDARSMLGMYQLEPNWWVQSRAGECQGSCPCTACLPYNSMALMKLHSCVQQATHRCMYMHRCQPTGWGVSQYHM